MNEYRLLLKDIDIPDIEQIGAYAASGGYRAAARVLSEMTPEQVVEEVEQAGLRGRGGGWSLVGPRWRALLQNGAPHYLCVNANESEPGVFRDRKLVERNPHQIVEGILIAAYAIRAHVAYVYIRAEMARGQDLLGAAIEAAYAEGWLGRDIRGTGYELEVYIHPGAGAYIAGEETALLESIEGKRAEPRARPLQPSGNRVFGQPAAVHNVGTLAYVPHIIARGSAWFRGIGTAECPGTYLVCVSGHVRRPGLYELEVGAATLREIIDDNAGGVRPGHALKAVLPGGASSIVLRPEQLDVRLDPVEWAVPGGGDFPAVFGAGGIIVMDETTCMVDVALNLMKFYARESCGQCPPCREGAPWLRQVLWRLENGQGKPEDLDLLESVATQVSPLLEPRLSTLCRFGPGFAWSVLGFLREFREEFEQHLEEGGCPIPKDRQIKVPESVSVRF